ncbi:MAG: hypothetical protein AAFU38_17915, partial [Bacteroidota bacterium]
MLPSLVLSLLGALLSLPPAQAQPSSPWTELCAQRLAPDSASPTYPSRSHLRKATPGPSAARLGCADMGRASDARHRTHRRVVHAEGTMMLLEELVEEWTGSAWAIVFRTLRTYEDGLQTELLEQLWTGAAWANNFRSLDTYEDRLLTESVGQFWDDTAWANSSRDLFAYEDGFQTENVFQSWDGSAWVNNVRLFDTYEEGLLGEGLVQVWTGTAWEIPDGFQTENVFQSWD